MSGKNPFLGLGFGSPFITFSRGEEDAIASALILNLDAADTNSYPGSGSTWTDLSSSGRNFTLSGSPSVGDKFLQFSGTQYGERTSDSISLNSGATIEVYINMATVSYSESESAIFNHKNFSYFNLIHKRTSNKFRLEYKSVSSNSRQIFSSLSASADTWFHIVAVVDNTSGGKIYINGSLDSSNSDAGNLPSTLNSNAYIGYSSTQFYPQYKYALIREYNRSLTEAEVQQRYTDVQQRYNF